MSSADGAAAPRRRALEIGLLVAVCEIVLARLTFEPIPWFDAASSLVGIAVLSVGLVELMWFAAGNQARRTAYTAFALHFPVALVLGRLVGNALLARNQVLATATTLSIVALPPLIAAIRARPGARVGPSNATVLAGFVLATLIAASLRAGARLVSIDGADVAAGAVASFPPATVWAGLIAAWSLAALLCARRATAVVAAALSVAVAMWPARETPPNWTAVGDVAAGPDIVLLTVDTLRADAAAEMRSYQRLRDTGVVFSNAQVPSPWTLPSLATIMTGVGPDEHGALRLDDGGIAPIAGDRPTLAERLSAAGYDTAAILAPNVFVSPAFGLARGFDHFDYALDRASFAQPVSTGDSAPRLMVPDLLMSAGLIGRRPFGGADVLARRVASLLEHRRQRPLFLWVHFLDCHIPYRHAASADLPRSLRVELSGGDAVDLARAGVLDADAAWTAYNHEIGRIDAALNDILDRLELSARPAVIALTADHGEEIFDHGGFEHGHTLYDELLRVPLVVSGLTRRRPGAVEGEPVGVGDLVPTLLAAAGLPAAGQNLDLPIERRVLRSWNLLYGRPDLYAVREGPWKLIARPNGVNGLFNLAEDPGERADRSEARPDLVARLNQPPAQRPRAEARQLSPAQENALRMLGYLEER